MDLENLPVISEDDTPRNFAMMLREMVFDTRHAAALAFGLNPTTIGRWETDIEAEAHHSNKGYPPLVKFGYLASLMLMSIERYLGPDPDTAILEAWQAHFAKQLNVLIKEWPKYRRMATRITWTTITTLANQYQQRHGPVPNTDIPSTDVQATSALPAKNPSLVSQKDTWQSTHDSHGFYGRQEEVNTLVKWINDISCSVILVWGAGGIGKTTLVSKVVTEQEKHFDKVIWHSVLDPSPMRKILEVWLSSLSEHHLTKYPVTDDECLALLRKYLEQQRCLLVLDNFDSLLQPNMLDGSFIPEYSGYSQLIQLFAKTQYRGCLVLTSREVPLGVQNAESDSGSVRTIRLDGIDVSSIQAMLEENELEGDQFSCLQLAERFWGNPLALNIVAGIIKEDFRGKIDGFLNFEGYSIASIEELLAQQFSRLHPLERDIIYWLAINRAETTLPEIVADSVGFEHGRDAQQFANSFGAKSRLLHAIRAASTSLQRRALLERNNSGFFLQNVILEFVTAQLVESMTKAITANDASFLNSYPLLKAQAPEYIREAQERLILNPVCQNLGERPGTETLARFQTMVLEARISSTFQPGYLAANVLHLSLRLRLELAKLDLSGLPLRQAYLRGYQVTDLNLRRVLFENCVFVDTFGRCPSIAYSPTGSLLAVGTADGEILLYETSSYDLVQVLQGHRNFVRSLVFSPDGTKLLSGGHDQTVKLWDIKTGTFIHDRADHNDMVFNVVYSPDGTWFASSGNDGHIILWDATSGKPLRVITEHKELVMALAVSPDGSILASGSGDCTIRFWDVPLGKARTLKIVEENWIVSVVFSPDGSRLASTGGDGRIRVWDIYTGEKLLEMPGNNERIWSLAWHPDGALIASASYDNTVTLWAAMTGERLHTFAGHTNQVWCVRFNPDKLSLASSSDDFTTRIWELKNRLCIRRIEGYQNTVKALAVSPDGSLIARSGADNQVTLVETSSGKSRLPLMGHKNWIKSIAFLQSGTQLVSAGQDQTVRIWNIEDNRQVNELDYHTDWIYTASPSPDGQVIASAGIDRNLCFWYPDSNEKRSFKQPYVIRTIVWDSMGRRVITGSQDPIIRIIGLDDGKEEEPLLGHTKWVLSLAMSPDGKLLASASSDHSIRIWDWRTRTCRAVLTEHTSGVLTTAFNSTSMLLASGSIDKTVCIWDVGTFKRRHLLNGHQAPVTALAWLPDGRRLVTGSEDGTVQLWNASEGSHIQTWKIDKPYERTDISGAHGLTQAQHDTLKRLGAVEM